MVNSEEYLFNIMLLLSEIWKEVAYYRISDDIYICCSHKQPFLRRRAASLVTPSIKRAYVESVSQENMTIDAVIGLVMDSLAIDWEIGANRLSKTDTRRLIILIWENGFMRLVSCLFAFLLLVQASFFDLGLPSMQLSPAWRISYDWQFFAGLIESTRLCYLWLSSGYLSILAKCNPIFEYKPNKTN